MLNTRMPYRYRVYLHGLIAAIINGVSNSVVVVMADPQQFNLFQGGAGKLGMVAGASAVFAFMTYLKDHPLPDPTKDKDFNQVKAEQVATAKSAGTGTGGGDGG